jgi:tripartite-type tricarboxylate transporter receptor subunit TctC
VSPRRGMPRGVATSLIAALFILSLPAAATAQSYPDRSIKVVVPFPAGGPTDTIARVLTQDLAADLGQSVVVENVSGAGGRVGCEVVARSPPDGYTLLLGGTSNTITPALYKDLNYDPVNDFAPVAPIATDSEVLVVHPSVPAMTLTEFVRYAKDNPGKLSSGATVGIAPHVMLELFRVRSGINMVFIPYKGAAPAIADLLGGHIQVHMGAKSVLLPLIENGKMRALAVTSAERWPELPDVPTMRERGFEGFPTALWFGLLAPAGTPAAVIGKLNAAVNARLKAPETRAAIGKLGLDARPLTPEEFGRVLADDVKLWRQVTEESGVKPE